MENNRCLIKTYRQESSELAEIAHRLYLDYVSTGQDEYLKKHNAFEKQAQVKARTAKTLSTQIVGDI